MEYEIKRDRLPVYNDTNQNVLAERTNNVGRDLLLNPMAYKAAVETAAVDLSLAILDLNPRYRVMIFCELKDAGDGKPEGLQYGPNWFSFNEPLSTVDQFLLWLNNILTTAPAPYNLGVFGINDDDFFTYSISQADYDQTYGSGNFRVYINQELNKILDSFAENASEQMGNELFHELAAKPGESVANSDRMYRLNKIESILFMTTLPVTPTNVLAVDQNTSTSYPIVGSMEVNNLQYNVRMKSDWRYEPKWLREYTMNQSAPIDQYSVRVVLLYNNTKMHALTLAPGERFIANLVFFPR